MKHSDNTLKEVVEGYSKAILEIGFKNGYDAEDYMRKLYNLSKKHSRMVSMSLMV